LGTWPFQPNFPTTCWPVTDVGHDVRAAGAVGEISRLEASEGDERLVRHGVDQAHPEQRDGTPLGANRGLTRPEGHGADREAVQRLANATAAELKTILSRS
jgi:hypothetical protein